MPAGKFKSISISEECYNKLKEIADARGISISKAIEQIVFEKRTLSTTINEDVIRKIVSEEVSKALKDFKTTLYNIISESNKPEKEKKKPIEAIKEAFLGERKPIVMKKVPIQISKSNIFIEGITELDLDLSKFKAKAIEEPNEKGETIGLSIVPDIGFENMSLEEWFDEYGSKLLKELMSILSKS